MKLRAGGGGRSGVVTDSWMLCLLLGALLHSSWLCAGAPSNQPYIDQLLHDMKSEEIKNGETKNETSQGFNAHEKAPSSSYSPYLDQEKLKLQQQDGPKAPAGSYIEELKNSDPMTSESKKDNKGNEGKGESYLEQQNKLLGPKAPGGAIEALKEGKSDLKFKRPGISHHAMGFRFSGVTPSRIVEQTVNGATVNSFPSIYGNGIYAPEFTAFYEYRPFEAQWYGSFGLLGSIGMNYFYGLGSFTVNLPRPLILQNQGEFFPLQSSTKFQFFVMPVTIALIYRFNLINFLRPHVSIGPTVLGFLETRNDNNPALYGHSQGITFNAGLAIALDWISQADAWDLYAQHDVKHYYLTFDYNYLTPLSGVVSFKMFGWSAGMTFEY